VIVAKQYSLGKNERLKSRKSIEELFDKGRRFNVSGVRVYYSIEKRAGDNYLLRAGFSASSRIFKTAVHRNRIKRLLREAWRLQKQELNQQLAEQSKRLNVFLIYTGKELPLYPEVFSSVKKLVSKLSGLLLDEK
jgi:ribonuclease P protein component